VVVSSVLAAVGDQGPRGHLGRHGSVLTNPRSSDFVTISGGKPQQPSRDSRAAKSPGALKIQRSRRWKAQRSASEGYFHIRLPRDLKKSGELFQDAWRPNDNSRSFGHDRTRSSECRIKASLPMSGLLSQLSTSPILTDVNLWVFIASDRDVQQLPNHQLPPPRGVPS